MSIGREPAIWAIACIAGTLLAASPAAAQCQYDVTVIQGPDVCGILGPVITIGTGLNENGEVVGYWYCPASDHRKAFVWAPESGLVTLDIPTGFSGAEAWDINGLGHVVGRITLAAIDRYRAALWQDGQAFNLGTLPGGNYSEAFAVNSSGQVVGRWGNNIMEPLFPRAFLWKDGKMIDLELPLGSRSAANDINEQGQVVGWMGQSFSIDSHAFIWEDGRVIDLGVIPGGFTARARAINNSGTVAGSGRVPFGPGMPLENQTLGFVWNRQAMRILHPLPGHLLSAAADVNDVGQVVGGSGFTVDNHSASAGFIWQNGVMTNLNDLIPAGAGVHINGASAINNAGQIAGKAGTPEATMAVLLTPVNVRVGDVDIDCAVGLADLEILLNSWGPCPDCVNCLGDLDGDCAVAVPDLLMLLANWG